MNKDRACIGLMWMLLAALLILGTYAVKTMPWP